MASVTAEMISDLRIKEEKLRLIRPSKVGERGSFFLSNIDQSLVASVIQLVFFFSLNVETSFDPIVHVATEALSNILSSYDFMCGRLAFNSQQQRFEIDCNAAGVPLVFCTNQLSLEDLSDISYPNPAFSQLVYLPGLPSSDENGHLPSFQITCFKDRGLALGIAIIHCLMDGFGMQEFIRNFAHLLTTGELAFRPVTDRTCLKARSPPQIKFQHLDYLQPSDNAPNFSPFMTRKNNIYLFQRKLTLHSPSDKHGFLIFILSAEMLRILKAKVMDGGATQCKKFMAALAHVWRARSAAIHGMKSDEISTVHFAVDIRSKLEPPFPREFVDNALLMAYAKATAEELHDFPLAAIVKKLEEGVERLNDEYVRSVIDWKELHDSGPYMTNWLHLRIQNLRNGGFVGPFDGGGVVVSGRANVVILLPNRKEDGGMKIYIGLQHAQMAIFENLILDVDVKKSVKCKL